MQKKQPMLYLLSTHIFRVLIYTAFLQKSSPFIKSSEMLLPRRDSGQNEGWNKMDFVHGYKNFIKK